MERLTKLSLPAASTASSPLQDAPVDDEPAFEVAAPPSPPEKSILQPDSVSRTSAPASPATKPLRPMTWTNLAPVTAAELAAYDIPPRPKYRIVVAVRHVGILNESFNISETQSPPTEAFDFRINEWDEAGVEEALGLSEKLGDCEVVVVTIGDDGAEASLRKALAMGAHRGVRIWHESLRDADPIIIARGLAGIAKHEQPDLFFCGVQSADQGNGATGTVLAGIMRLPHSAAVVKCDWDGSNSIAVTRELEGGTHHYFQLPIPAVLTIQTGMNRPRYATMRMIKQAKQKPITVIDGEGLDDGSSGYAIQRMFKPTTGQATMLEGGADDVAAFVIERIAEARGA
jgi:electron transfer flavoprotein alpha/beta subunit